jgi:hypothetical protein
MEDTFKSARSFSTRGTWTIKTDPHGRRVAVAFLRLKVRGLAVGDRSTLGGLTHFRAQFGVPFKSQAQRRKFAQLLVEGKISNETLEEWNRETGAKRLPERASRKRNPQRSPPARTVATGERAVGRREFISTLTKSAQFRPRPERERQLESRSH